MQDEYPVFHVTCITHRKDPIYAATVVGKPPMEDAWMGKAVERIFLPLMQLTLPEIVDVCLPPEAVFHNLMIVSIRKSYAGHARKVMNGIWAMGQAMFTKCIMVVDEDCDVQDLAEVMLRVGQQHRSGARHPVHAGAGGLAGPRLPAAELRIARWGSTRRASGRRKASRARGRRC